MKVCVLGLGYIGLPTAVMLATAGHRVVGFDIDPRVRSGLRDREAHIHEPGLEDRLCDVLASGQFEVVDEPVEADAFILAVPTPVLEGPPKRADVGAIERAGA